jgi:hypothetical protein
MEAELEELIEHWLNRPVGFELFDPQFAPPEKTFLTIDGRHVYVAMHPRHVLLGFADQERAQDFFDEAMKVTVYGKDSESEWIRLVPTNTYVAMHGRYVLLRFSNAAHGEEFFRAAMKASS